MRIVYFFIFILFLPGCSSRYKEEKLYEENYKYQQEGNVEKQIEVLEKFKKFKFINGGRYSDYSSKELLFRDLGRLYAYTHKYKLSLENYREAKNKIKGDNNLSRKGYIDNMIARVYSELGQYNKAIILLENALAQYKLGGMRLTKDIEMQLANLYIKNNDTLKAKTLIQKTFNTRNNYDEDTSALDCEVYNFMGTIFLNEENYEEAKKYYLHPYHVSKKPHPEFNKLIQEFPNVNMIWYKLSGQIYYDTALSSYNLGVLNFKQKKYFLAIKYFNNAINSLKKQRNISNVGIENINYFLALAYYAVDKSNDKTLPLLKEALRVLEYTKPKTHLAWIYDEIATYYYFINDFKNYYLFQKKAYDIFIENRIYTFLLLNNYEKKNYINKFKKPINYLLGSAKDYHTLYATYEKNKTKSIKGKEKLSQITLTDWLNYKGSISDIENMIRTLKKQTIDSAIIEQVTKLEEAQKAYATFIQNGQKKEILEKKKSEIDEIFKWLALKVNKFQEENELKFMDYRDIAKYLKKDELYIDYARAGDDYYLFSLDQQENVSFVRLEKHFLPLIQAFRAEIKNIVDKKIANYPMNQNSKDRLSELYKLLLEPIKEQLSTKKSLIISTDGALRLLPFEIFYNKEKQSYLIEEKNIRYIPSGKEFVRLHKYTKKETTSSSEIVVFANPNWNKTSNENSNRRVSKFYQDIPLDSLKGTEEELKEIKRLFGKNVSSFKNEYASEVNLLKVKRPKILHIATHGFFNSDKKIKNPMLKSGLVLSGANQSRKDDNINGFTTALKLSVLDLKGTELVVLSACDTGMVDIEATDSISGLGKVFIQAGAKDVVMSLWSVNDTMTKELMINFYQNIKNGLSYSHAMKEAKLKMIKKGLHPFYWGGFVLSGL